MHRMHTGIRIGVEMEKISWICVTATVAANSCYETDVKGAGLSFPESSASLSKSMFSKRLIKKIK